MIEANINGIFPTPIYISKLNRELTNKELSFIDKTKLDVYKNEGNTTSNDNYILNNKLFKDLKTDLDLRVKDYFEKVISPVLTENHQDSEFHIFQSFTSNLIVL